MNVMIENSAAPCRVLGVAKDETLRHARETMDNVGLSGYDQRLPSELSGGRRPTAWPWRARWCSSRR